MISFLEIYAGEIIPRLKAIDLCIKSGERIAPEYAAGLLCLTMEEIHRLRGPGSIRGEELLSLMERGSGCICRMYRRELERNSPNEYTAGDISYIYGIDENLVNAAFDKLKAAAVTEYMLPRVFAEIWIDK